MSIFDKIQRAIGRALGRFAARKTSEQAQGMENEARGIVDSIKRLARANPAGLGVLVALSAVLIWLALRQREGNAV